MRLVRSFLLAAAALLAACSGGGGGAGGSSSPPSYDRTALGDQATYRITFGGTSSIEQVATVTASSATGFTRSVQSGGAAPTASTYQRVGQGQYLVTGASGGIIYSPPAVILPASLAAGTVEVTSSTVQTATATSTATHRATVVGREQVTVPLGTFEAVKVSTAIVPSDGGSSTVIAWWAPGVGQVKSVTYLEAIPGTAITSELVAFAAPPVASPPQGVYPAPQAITLASATADATVVYTTDGSEPGPSSPAYSAPLQLRGSITLKAAPRIGGRMAGPSIATRYVLWSGPSVDPATACAALSDKAARLRRSCAGVHPALLGDPTSDPACASLVAEVASGRVRFDGTAAYACLVAVQPLGCTGLAREGSLVLPSACAAVMAGTVPYAGSCTSTKDCISGICTSDVFYSCPGVCNEASGVGQPCGNGPCAEGWACNQATGACAPASGPGGPCPCHPGSWCDASTGTATCAALLPAGASCSGADQCAAGTACTADCLPTDPAPCGHCRTVVSAGESCAPGGPPCADGYWCSAGTCVPWPSTGQACVVGVGCLGGACAIPGSGHDNTCVAGFPDGSACFADAQCATGFCNVFTQRCQGRYCLP